MMMAAAATTTTSPGRRHKSWKTLLEDNAMRLDEQEEEEKQDNAVVVLETTTSTKDIADQKQSEQQQPHDNDDEEVKASGTDDTEASSSGDKETPAVVEKVASNDNSASSSSSSSSQEDHEESASSSTKDEGVVSQHDEANRDHDESLVRETTTTEEDGQQDGVELKEEECDEKIPDNLVFLTFQSYLEVQSRLVLLPRIEEEGIGAVVHSFVSDDQEVDVDGRVLRGMQTPADVSLRDLDFCDILAAIRECDQLPIQLYFEPDPDQQPVVEEVLKEPEQPQEAEATPNEKDSRPPKQQQEKDDPKLSVPNEIRLEANEDVEELQMQDDTTLEQEKTTTEATPVTTSSLFKSWSNRMRTAASTYYNQNVVQPSSDAKSPPPKSRLNDDEPIVALFIQTPSGKLDPIAPSTKVTTSSVILLRQHADGSSLNAKEVSFQWFRSVRSQEEQDHEWVQLKGAIHAAYQPSATDIGHYVQCQVSFTPPPTTTDQDDGEDDDKSKPSPPPSSPSPTTASMPCCILADSTMLNGARQALLRGARFSSLRGRNKSEGRVFSVLMELSNLSGKMTSAITIEQVRAGTSEPIHVQPLLNVSALADSSNPKALSLTFPTSHLQEEGACLVDALCDDETGCFPLQMPNRIMRETFLMTLGIANYKGRPADLNVTTMLFPEAPVPPKRADDIDDDLLPQAVYLSPETSVASMTTPPFVLVPPTGDPVMRTMTTTGSATRSENSSAEEGYFTPPQQEKPIIQTTATTTSDAMLAFADQQQEQLKALLAKMARKDKVISDLQRQLASSDQSLTRTCEELTTTRQDLRDAQRQVQSGQAQYQELERRMQGQADRQNELNAEHSLAVSKLEQDLLMQQEEIAALTKANKSLQNEKAVMMAAVEARDGKLERMTALDTQVKELKQTLRATEDMQRCLRRAEQQSDVYEAELVKKREETSIMHKELQAKDEMVQKLQRELQQERKRTEQVRAASRTGQESLQRLQTERNSYKQKADSLQREMSRLCQKAAAATQDGTVSPSSVSLASGSSSGTMGGATLKDVEQVMENYQARQTEVEVLKRQKKQALEDVEEYRTAYQHLLVSQLKGGNDGAAHLLNLEQQKLELERVVSHLTEYVHAKEQQLETVKAVNLTLSDELRALAKANMEKNEI